MGRKRKHNNRKGPTRNERRPSLIGTVHLLERGGYVTTAEGEYRLTGRGVREAMDGDTVSISLQRVPRGGKNERRAVVESVVERVATSIVGRYEPAGPLGCVRPLDTRLHADFFVLPEDKSAQALGVQAGDIVNARIVSYPSRMESGVVTIERRIGDADAPDLGVQCIMARYGYTDEYPQAALAEAKALRLDVDEALQDPLRRDIRERFAITIDPIDARDFDDSISIEKTADGYTLGVHIADVSHYVCWEGHVDLEARQRTTSVYLADRVLPMLPEALSNELCSLKPQEDRLAFTVDMELDRKGRVKGYDIYPSVIRSKVRMDYEAAEELLIAAGAVARNTGTGQGSNAEESAAAARLRAQACEEAARACSADLTEFLLAAHTLAQKRAGLRRKRGSIDFNTVEVHALLDAAGLPTEIVCRKRSAATGLIEEAMLLANECVAEYLADRDIDCAYRVHEAPSPDSLHSASATLLKLGIVSQQQASGIALGNQKAMQEVVDQARDTPTEPLVNALMLRAMQRAFYKPQNEGHYALGASAYCHFTSPIRRYPDLLVHRALKLQLAYEELGGKAAKERAARFVGVGRESLPKIAAQLCRACSDKERAADSAASSTQKIKIAQFYEHRIGQRFSGSVSWISNMGVFVRLDDTQVEGLVPMKTLGDEWFIFDEEELTLTGANTGRRIELGQAAVVELTSVSTTRGHLNFELIH